jgi:hypothetical protein
MLPTSERRHTGDAGVARHAPVGVYGVAEPAFGQHRPWFSGREPDRRRQLDEDVEIVDVAALREVSSGLYAVSRRGWVRGPWYNVPG